MQESASTSGTAWEDRLAEAAQIRDLLKRNDEEVKGVLRALNGEYILPEAGGDLLRDGPGVLPTGNSPSVLHSPCADSTADELVTSLSPPTLLNGRVSDPILGPFFVSLPAPPTDGKSDWCCLSWLQRFLWKAAPHKHTVSPSKGTILWHPQKK